MLIDGKAHKVFDFKDINSLVSFEEWLKSSLTIYPEDSTIPSAHIVSLLEYLRDTVRDQKVTEKRKWLEQIEFLIERAKQ
tara:strand:+ start:273 stop:512 length:240 start_codon:yes stop_codon:yes gene_type:complete